MPSALAKNLNHAYAFCSNKALADAAIAHILKVNRMTVNRRAKRWRSRKR